MQSQVQPAFVLPPEVISVRDLSKRYAELEALKGIDFAIQEGEIFGLIGPDGAGKTTAFHILSGIMEQTRGQVVVLGTVPRNVRLEIGYLTQVFSLYLDLSVNENIEYAARIREVPEEEFLARRDKYLKLMDLHRFCDRLAGQLSGGMKQKLALCCALIARPKVLLLDEPTTGVDPVSRRDFWDVLGTISSEGVTVAVATPYLDEAERCNRVALMHKGTIYQIGSPEELKRKLNLKRLEIRGDKALLEKLQTMNSGIGNIHDIQEFGDRLDVLVEDARAGADEIRSFVSAVSKESSSLAIEELEPTLENVFVASLKDTAPSFSPPFPFAGEQNKSLPSSQAIVAQNISKHFGHFHAVKEVSLSVNYGEIYGLLGANGAGKTTTIKMLCGLLDASSGQMMISGRKHDLRNIELRKQIGYMSQKFVLYDDLTLMENLGFYCGAYGIGKEERKERLEWAISTFELSGYEDTLTGALPGGWKQKLSFAASVLHQPSILFLDEPTSGVDPIARRQLWKYIRQFARNGAAILVTTHFLEEAEHCQRLGFMAAGQLVAQGTPSQIKQGEPGQLLELNVDAIQLAYKRLKEVMDRSRVSIFGSRLHIALENPENEKPIIYRALKDNGVNILAERIIPFSLEDAFIGIVRRAKEEQ